MSTNFPDESTAIVEAIDNLYARATEHVPLMYTFPDVQVNEAMEVLVPCFHHSLLSLHVSHSLTADGLYGPAHAHLRHAFEALIIAKFCSVNPDADVYDRWVDGVELYFTNSVLKKIITPQLSETRELWKLLCEKSHATIWSGQGDLHLAPRLADVRFNFAIIGVLLRWASHLYSGHILTPTAAYYGRRYRRNAQTIKAREQLRKFFSWHRQFLAESSRALIREYTQRWSTRQNST